MKEIANVGKLSLSAVFKEKLLFKPSQQAQSA